MKKASAGLIVELHKNAVIHSELVATKTKKGTAMQFPFNFL